MLMKKLTGSTEKNSSESTLSTKSCKLFESNDGSLTICDTPEISSSSERFQSNLDFAHALNFMAVDLVLIPLKAGKNRDSVEKFLPQEFPKELITFCTNQMDEANFGEKEQMKYINKESQELIKEIKDDCLKKKPFEMSVDSKMFSELFELTDHDRSILIKSRKEGERFRKMKQVFYDEWKDYTESEQMDSIFEFQAWIHDEIVRSKKQLSGDKNFKLIITDQNKTDHIGILEDQLHEILRDLRLKVKKIVDKENIEHYKCPYCGKRWPKMDDCKGITKCGEDSCGNSELVERGKMANFFFSWEQDTEKLIISKVSQEKAESQKGCGAEVSWFKMVPVKLRKTVDKIDCASTKDTKPKRKKKWNEVYDDELDRKKMPEMKKAKDLAD